MSEERSNLRDYLGPGLQIDGRQICYRLVTAHNYLIAKGMTESEVESFRDDKNEIYELINQVMALKQCCFMLRRTSYSCGSLSDNLYYLKQRLIRELRDEHGFDFDDAFVESDSVRGDPWGE